MTDYNFTTGSTGTMMIRHNGDIVEFYFQAGYSNDHWDPLQFNYTANGSTSNTLGFDYNTGRPWLKVGQVTVTNSQTVYFRLLTRTGTQGMGGPTTVSRYIDRGGPPDPPNPIVFPSWTSTSAVANFTDRGNGGLPIDTRRIGYGKSAAAPQFFITSDGSTTITGLSAGTTYYFWAQAHNAKGWGEYSSRRQITTQSSPPKPTNVTFSDIRQTQVDTRFSGTGDGGSYIIRWELGYGTSPLSPQFIVPSNGILEVTGLSPGATYYFWARGVNSIGNGPWSSITSVQLIAGAYVTVGNLSKRAVPYVRVGGVWKIARPWVKVSGVWKESQ